MKKSVVPFLSLVLFAFLFTAAGVKADSPLPGSWSFNIPQAPWEYSKGKMIFENDADDKITGKIKFDSGREVRIARISQTEDKYTFEVNVEGTPVKTVVTLKDNNMTGVVETYDGNIPFSAKKEVPEN
jgi:hypothetical protein